MEPIKPEEAIEMLRKNGMIISNEEAKLMLEFLRRLAAIIVAQHLESSRSKG